MNSGGGIVEALSKSQNPTLGRAGAMGFIPKGIVFSSSLVTDLPGNNGNYLINKGIVSFSCCKQLILRERGTQQAVNPDVALWIR